MVSSGDKESVAQMDRAAATKPWCQKVGIDHPRIWPVQVRILTRFITATTGICCDNEPIGEDGFVINVRRADDPPGRCWGTTIYPKPVK